MTLIKHRGTNLIGHGRAGEKATALIFSLLKKVSKAEREVEPISDSMWRVDIFMKIRKKSKFLPSRPFLGHVHGYLHLGFLRKRP